MADLDLDEGERLLAAATPGPWTQCPEGDAEYIEAPSGDVADCGGPAARWFDCPDAAAIVWSVNSALALIAKVRELADVREAVDVWKDSYETVKEERDSLATEVKRLKAEINELQMDEFEARIDDRLSRLERGEATGGITDVEEVYGKPNIVVSGGPLDGMVVREIPANPTPAEEEAILDAGVKFVMGADADGPSPPLPKWNEFLDAEREAPRG